MPIGLGLNRQREVCLHLELGFQSGRLADLVKLLAKAGATITDLEPDRSLYHIGMPERWTKVMFLVKSARHKAEILSALSKEGFLVQEVSGLPS